MTPIRRHFNGLIVGDVLVTLGHRRETLVMAIDTGAIRTVLDATVAAGLGLIDLDRADRPVTGVGGQVATLSAVLGRVEFAGRRRDRLPVSVVTVPWDMAVHGLLGLDFLGVGRLGLDFDAGTIALT